MDAIADLIALGERAPRIVLHLFHAETDATRLWIDTKYFDLDSISRAHELTRMFHTFRPTHLGNVHQPFDSRFELDERAIVSNARHATVDPRHWRKTLFNCFPGIGQKLFITQRDTLTVTIKPKHFDLDTVANLEHLCRIMQAPP